VGRLTGRFTSSTGTVIKHVIEGRIVERIDTRGRRGRRCKQLVEELKEKRKAENWRRKYWFALCWELVLEEATDLSSDRLCQE